MRLRNDMLDDMRNDLSRDIDRPQFYHFGSDIAGNCLVGVYGLMDRGCRLFLFDLGEPGVDTSANAEYLLNAGCSCVKQHHIHPLPSPDGRTVFFNSDDRCLFAAPAERAQPPCAARNIASMFAGLVSGRIAS